jgi:hypothetical protein
MIDLEVLKAKLAEYDPAAPKCQLQIERFVNYAPDHITSLNAEYHDYDETTYVPCCRPEGHEDECRNARQVIGWPGFETVSALVAEVERLREMLLNAGWPRESDELAAMALRYERAAVVAYLRDVRYYLLADCIERGEHRKENE